MSQAKTIDSEDLSIARVFQSFYRVPDYQREYVWGEKNAEGERGDEVDHRSRLVHSAARYAVRLLPARPFGFA